MEGREQRYRGTVRECPRGFAAPVHVHEREAEGFYVLEGEVTSVIRSRTLRASPGSFAFVPGNVKHAFRVNSPVAKFLALITPSGLESFFEELSEPAKARTLPSAHVKPASMERLLAVATRYNQKFFGPPPSEEE